MKIQMKIRLKMLTRLASMEPPLFQTSSFQLPNLLNGNGRIIQVLISIFGIPVNRVRNMKKIAWKFGLGKSLNNGIM